MADFIQDFNDPNKKIKQRPGMPEGMAGGFNNPNVKIDTRYIPPDPRIGDRPEQQQKGKSQSGQIQQPNFETGQYVPPNLKTGTQPRGVRGQSYKGISFEDYGSGGWQNMTPEQRRVWETESGYNPSRSPAGQSSPQGRQVTQKNPAFGGAPAQTTEFNLPEEGEIFTGQGGGQLFTVSGGKVRGLDPQQAAPELWSGDATPGFQEHRKGSTAAGITQGAFNLRARENLEKSLGHSLGDISEYNLAGVTGAFPSQQGSWKWADQQLGVDEFSKLVQAGVTPGVDLPEEESFEDYNARYLANQRAPQTAAQAEAGIQPTRGGGGGWIDPATGQATPAGVGIPEPAGGQIPPGAELISDPSELSGLTEEQIFRDPNSDNIYKVQQATLTSPTGEKKVVGVGSQEANNLLSSGWTLGDKVGGGTVDAQLLTDVPEVNIGQGMPGGTGSLADSTAAGIGVDIKSTDDAIKRNLDLLTAPETDLSRQVSDLLGETGDLADTLTGRGAAQLSAEEARGIEEQNQVMADKNTELKKKVAEINALTASFDLANVTEEGRPQTLSRLQGAQARNYRMYIAQKNLLTSEASYMQAELLGLQGKLQAAQNAADRAVELEYADREAAFNAKIAQLNILQPQLDKEEAKYAQAVSLTLNQQADALANEKANKKEILNIKLQAISAGITDASILSQIGQAGSYEEALQIMGTNMPAPVISGGGGGSGEEQTDFEKAVSEAAQNIRTLESSGASNSDSYWNVVNQFSEAMGIDSTTADKLIMKEIQNQKGETYQAPQIEEEIASDFETFISSPESAPAFRAKANIKELKRRAVALIKKARAGDIAAKNELATIPEFVEGERVWNRALSGV